jgi:phosphomevalonate kinase
MASPAAQIASSRPLEIRRVRVPAALRLLLADTGSPASTRSLVREVRAFAAGDPARWKMRAADISAAAEKLRDALESDNRELALRAVRSGAAAMAALGESAQVPIVTPELLRACALASAAGAAGKPSGAGGGDCAVIVAFGDEARDRAEAALQPHFPVLRVAPA